VKKELDSRLVIGIVALLLVAVVIVYIRSASDQVVPASAIKSPPPPGGFPGKLPPSAGATAQKTAAPTPE